MPKEYFKKKGQSNRFKMRNPLQYASAPLKKHDGTPSTNLETHNADGTQKSDKEVEYLSVEEYDKKQEELYQRGLSPEEVDQMMEGYAIQPAKTTPPTKQLGVMGGDVDIVDPMLGGQVSGPIGTGIYYKKKKKY